MAKLVAVFLLFCVVVIVLSSTTETLGLSVDTEELTKSFIQSLFGLIPLFHQVLERKRTTPEKSQLLLAPKGIISFNRFLLSPYLIAVYGFSIAFAAAHLTIFTAGVIGSTMINFYQSTDGVVAFFAVLLTYIVMPIMYYLVGRWVGFRCSKNGRFVTIAIVATCSLFLMVENFYLISAEEYELVIGQPRELSSAIIPMLVVWVVLLLFALLGYRRGFHRRIERYLNYLVKKLPTETKALVTDLVYDEVNRLTPARTRT